VAVRPTPSTRRPFRSVDTLPARLSGRRQKRENGFSRTNAASRACRAITVAPPPGGPPPRVRPGAPRSHSFSARRGSDNRAAAPRHESCCRAGPAPVRAFRSPPRRASPVCVAERVRAAAHQRRLSRIPAAPAGTHVRSCPIPRPGLAAAGARNCSLALSSNSGATGFQRPPPS